MKALSVRQPWATLIAEGSKAVEVRSWRTPYRGPLLICSASKMADGYTVDDEDYFPRGAAVCVVQLCDVVPMVASAHAVAADPIDPRDEVLAADYSGLYAWLLSSPQVVQPFIPVKGKLNLFDVDLPPDTRLIEPKQFFPQ